MVVEELQVSDGKTCDLACWVVNYTRTPDNLVKSSAFYTRSLSVRSQMVAPVAASQLSLRDHRMIVHHKLREQSVAFHNNTTGNSTLLNIAQTIDI